MRHHLHYLGLAISMLACAGGASCPKRFYQTPPMSPAAPDAFLAASMPQLPDILRAVNSNSGRVQNLRADSAKLSVTGYPSLRADLALERPRNFRLRAKLLSAPMLDVGSNHDLFWFWVREAPTRAVLYSRHDQFAQSAAAQILPIEPTWLPEALGLPYLDPRAAHDGPRTNPSGNLEISTRIQTASGPRVKVTEIHPRYGWVLRQDVADVNGRLLVSARCSDHRYYALPPEGGVSLPHMVQLYMAPEGQPAMTLEIAISSYSVNQPYATSADTWRMPEVSGYPPMDLARMRLQVQSPLAAAPADWQRAAQGPTQPPPLQFRGYTQDNPGNQPTYIR